jgi:hypothetical protein
MRELRTSFARRSDTLVAMRVWLLVLGACGRIGFDPSSPDDPGGAIDAAGTTGDAPGDGGMTTIDATDLCVGAIPVSVGTTAPLDTCTGTDRLDTCSTAKRELVFRFVPPTTRLYLVAARDPGTANVSNSTTRLTAGCTARTGTCAGILGTQFAAGVPVYFAVEASSGACASIELEITAN